jgi:hypothetical protein
MKAFTVSSISLVLLVVFAVSTAGQTKSPAYVIPKYSLSVSIGYDYAFAKANGDARGFSTVYNEEYKQALFTAKNYGMQQGGNIIVTGKVAIDKRKKFRLTGALGYTLFYNSEDAGMNRTKWSIFTLGAGMEYDLKRNSKTRSYVSFELDYNLLFGAWQTDVTFPDNTMSNIYIKFKPESRLGIAVGTGAEFKVNKRTYVIAGIKGVWANIAPKQNSYTVSGYDAYLNDSGNSSGINLGSSKQIIYMQIFSGISFALF